MTYASDDTIAAIATASGGAARGMVRVSGPAVREIVERCFARTCDSGDNWKVSVSSRATATTGSVRIVLGEPTSRKLPCDLFLWPSERSYTREPVAEFHTLGSAPLVRAVLEAVCQAGARLAEPGEFTLRAFLSGRVDLTQAEAVLGVIDARHAGQLDTALAQLAGGLARPLHALRDELLQLLAELEAGLDFVDEDIEFISAEQLGDRLAAVAAELSRLVLQMSSRHTQIGRARVALIGPPNAGKSSLFNALVARSRKVGSDSSRGATAIVSAQRHTTRDYLTAAVEVGVTQYELIDTAGVDKTGSTDLGMFGDQRESFIAVAQTQAAEVRSQADLRVLCVDASADEADGQFLDAAAVGVSADLVVLTKCDLCPRVDGSSELSPSGIPLVRTSSVMGQGLDELCGAIAARLDKVAAEDTAGIVATTADRCRDSLRLAESAVSRATEATSAHSGDELVAAELRIALAELGKVVGAVYTDDLLDRIFKTFCIGK